MQKLEQLYSGKAKTLYASQDPQALVVLFRNDTTAFNGVKSEQLSDKGKVNNHFNAFIMQILEQNSVPTHFIERLNDQESLVKRLQMIPVECVIRNITTGSLCKRLGIQEGLELEPPLFEFFLKDDALNDPLITEEHIRAFNWATDAEIKTMKEFSYKVNSVLRPLFLNAGMLLVDYKLEFGRYNGSLVLGDEFTPDGCRIWDVNTREKLDKDRFRKDLGGVVEAYQEVAKRLGIVIK